jgi:hypothetical protein
VLLEGLWEQLTRPREHNALFCKFSRLKPEPFPRAHALSSVTVFRRRSSSSTIKQKTVIVEAAVGRNRHL